MRSILPLLLLATLISLMSAQPCDLILTNAKIWTVDPAHPEAEAVAVWQGRIIAVGSANDILKLRTPSTTVLDVHGKRVLPGFIDDHTHFMEGGFQLQSIDLRDAADAQEFARRIAERVKKYPGRWVTGGDWDHDRWPGGRLPTKQIIDGVAPNTPVFVRRYDWHMAVANSHALELAKITKETPDPPGGTIVKDPVTGEPTGLLKDEAMSLVYAHIPDPSEEERLEAAEVALKEARTWGVTSIQDVSSRYDLATFRTLRDRGKLTARFHCRLPLWQWKDLKEVGVRVPFGDEWLRIGSLKAFVDGSLGSSTALFFDKYVSEDTKGLPMDVVLDGRLEQWARSADSAGLQLSIHAIGDSANSWLLDLFETIAQTNPAWDRRFRIEHAQHIHPNDFARFAKLGVIASAQPYHAIDDGRWAEKRIGRERCKTTYAFRTFLDNNVHLSFGSDWTVAPMNPLWGIYAAVTRRTTDEANPGGWFPEQKISVNEAIACYTINNAYAVFEENEKGSITVGKLADLVVLSEDILTIDPVRIEHVLVDMTIVGGTIVHQR